MDFVAGSIGGAAGCAVSHPLDTVKVRQQCCRTVTHYRGFTDCLHQIVKQESVRGLYKGLAAPISALAAINAVCFGTYGFVLRRVDDPNSLRSHFLAGGCAGLAMCPILSPVEMTKCKLQMQNLGVRAPSGPLVGHSHARMYTGPVNCVHSIYRREGLAGVYRGMAGLMLREVPSMAIYFPINEWLKQTYLRKTGMDDCPLFYLFLAGGTAGCVSWASTYPVDVIKSRIQIDGTYDTQRRCYAYKYSGYLDCLCQSLKSEGFALLFRGLPSACLRAFPSNGITLSVVSVIHSLFHRGDNSKQIYDND